MELIDYPVSSRTRKRKLVEEDDGAAATEFSMDDLNKDILERVLSWLPTSTFFRLSSVCKRWKSVSASRSFKLACSQIPTRDPWFFMVGNNLSRSIIYDTAERNWNTLDNSCCNLMPVAASGGLICFRGVSGNLLVRNPVTGLSRELPPIALHDQTLHAIAMNTLSNYHHSYRIILISGEIPKLSFWVYDSGLNQWEDEVVLARKADDAVDSNLSDTGDDNDAVYFLSKAGNVVATNLQRSPSKQYSSVMIIKNGEEIVYFLSSTGTIVACNLTQKCFTECPRLLPPFLEYSIDVVQCGGEMLVVLLSEFFESASLRVWRFDEKTRAWVQVAAMPPAMSHDFYGKKGDINCVGAGDKMLVCFNSSEMFRYFVCDLVANKWSELPRCFVDGEAVDFVSALSFEPRIEALV